MPAQSPTRTFERVKRPLCSDCGSDDVLFEAYAAFNPETAEFELSNTFVKWQFCQDCEAECSVI